MRTIFRFPSAILIVAILLLAGIALAQNEPAGNGDKLSGGHSVNVSTNATSDDLLKVKSDLVLVDVSVMDNKRNFVPGLDKPNFKVYEDQVEQQIEIFSKESVPVSIGFVIDTSGSMRFKLRTVLESAKKLLELCRPGDEVFVVDMKDATRIRFVQPYTSNFDQAKVALDKMYASGGTALLDAISTAGKYAEEHASNRRRALIVMSDGDERDSTIKVDQLLDQLRELNLQVYMLGFPEGFVDSSGAFMETSPGKAKNLMKKVAEESGGQAMFPHSLDEIGQMTDKIGQELRSQYTIGYYPNNDNRDGRWHKLQVKLADKKQKYAVRTRTGYFAGKN